MEAKGKKGKGRKRLEKMSKEKAVNMLGLSLKAEEVVDIKLTDLSEEDLLEAFRRQSLKLGGLEGVVWSWMIQHHIQTVSSNY